jgi:hypothetical protein
MASPGGPGGDAAPCVCAVEPRRYRSRRAARRRRNFVVGEVLGVLQPDRSPQIRGEGVDGRTHPVLQLGTKKFGV